MFNHLKKLTILIFTAFIGLPTVGFTQDEGTFDIRLLMHSIDCYNNILYCDIEIRAEEPDREFRLGDQYYAVSFNRAALADPFIAGELYVSGVVQEPGTQGFSAYDMHHTGGTLDTILRYNVQLAGGDGIYLNAEEYVGVGRVGFYIIDYTKPVYMEFLPFGTFPGTYIHPPDSYTYLPGTHLGYHQSLMGACDNAPPQAAYNNQITAEGQPITICVAENDNDPENLLDLTSVELLNEPPASEGTVTLDEQTGCVTFTPHPDFSGVATTFEYQICDEGVYILAYGGNENPTPLPLPDPANPDLQLQPPACDTTTITITVDGDLVGMTDANSAFSDFSVFPNPVDNVLNIKYDLSQKADVSLSIWNTLGQPIVQFLRKTQTADSYYESLDIGHLNAGQYFVVLDINETVFTRMIRIE